MEFIITVLTDIWNHINESIDWIIFLMVIASGYAIRSFALFKNIPKTRKVIFISLIVTLIYGFIQKIDPGVYVASYFLAFGFHTVLIKWLDSKILKSIGGGGQQKPPKD